MQQIRFFSDDIAARYGRRLHRIPLDLSLGCPNRPDRFGPGCVFCAEDGGRARHLARHLDLAGQVRAGIEFARSRYDGEAPWIAYFQAFTSTYAPVQRLRELYAEVLRAAEFKVVIIGTRPDALPPETIRFLAELARDYEVWVELGVQSAHDRTLELIRRGHDFAAVEDAVRRLHEAGISTAAHVIAGLPGENEKDFYETARRLARLPFRAVKLHQLLVLRGTPLASPDFPVKPMPLNEYEYARWAAGFLRLLPEEWLVMRLVAEAEPKQILAPRWWMSKGQFLEFFLDAFRRGGERDAFPGVRTADGSFTLYHPGFRQHFHSLAGAVSEAERKFVEPSRLAERLARGPVRLLEIGFGLGINTAAALRCARMAENPLEIISLELDLRVLDAAEALHPQHSLEREMVSSLKRSGEYRCGRSSVRLLSGDARKRIADAIGKFDVIFQDGFSPDCNPELWSFDFTRILARKLAADGVMVSYCSAFPYRAALLRAGLKVGESIPFGRRRGGTVSGFLAELPPLPLPEKEYGILLHSTAGVCYRDPRLDGTRETLRARRERTVARLRARGVPKWFRDQPSCRRS